MTSIGSGMASVNKKLAIAESQQLTLYLLLSRQRKKKTYPLSCPDVHGNGWIVAEPVLPTNVTTLCTTKKYLTARFDFP